MNYFIYLFRDTEICTEICITKTYDYNKNTYLIYIYSDITEKKCKVEG